jgi:hypothetical protein
LRPGLASLTRELSDPGTLLVNYQRRRQALGTWSTSEDTRPSLAARHSLMARPDSGDRKRQIANIRDRDQSRVAHTVRSTGWRQPLV